MLINVRLEDCALFIGETHFEQFQQVVAKEHMYEMYINYEQLNRTNYSQAIFNLWCLLLNDEENIIFNETKLFYYPLTRHLLEQIQQNRYFKHFKNTVDFLDWQQLVSAILIANALDKWLLQLLRRKNFNHIYARLVKLHKQPLLDHDCEIFQPFHNEVSQFIKQFFQQPEYNKQLDVLLKNSTNQATQVFKQG